MANGMMTDTRAQGLNRLPAFGVRLTLPGVGPADVLARCGFDFALIDQEHGAAGPESLIQQLLACEAAGVPALVRPPSAQSALLPRLLDLGAAGVLAPAVPDSTTARALAAALRYPPDGRRSVAGGTVRAAGYGADDAYEATWNGRAMLWAQIESPAALAEARAIAAVDGVDALFFGPADYAAAADYPGAAAVLAAFQKLAEAARASGKLVGAAPFADQDPARLAAAGADVILAGADSGYLRSSALASLAAARSGGA